MSKLFAPASLRQAYFAPEMSVRSVRLERGFAISGSDIEDAGSENYGTF